MKLWLKECPRCGGDLQEESNTFGRYISCMQCGNILTHIQETRLLTLGTLKALPLEEPATPPSSTRHAQL